MTKRSLLLLFILYHLSNSIKLHQTPPPPPPLPSFIPPPPPIPGMPSSQPQKKLKLIKWDNLPDALIQGSVFSDLEEVHYDNSALEKAFDDTPVTKKTLTPKKEIKNPYVFLVPDVDKNLLLSISLTTIKKYPIEKIKEAVNHLHSDFLNSDNILYLLNVIPKGEQATKIANLLKEKPNQIYGEQEQFLVDLFKIDNLETKLRIMDYIVSFEEMYKKVKEMTSSLLNAMKELKESKFLKKLISNAFYIGKYVSKGLQRGQAKGFKMEGLNLLNGVILKEGITSLDFIIQKMQSENASNVPFTPNGKASSAFPSLYYPKLDTIKTVIDEFNSNYGAKIKEMITLLDNIQNKEDSFYKEAKEKLNVIEGEIKEVKEMYNECLDWLKKVVEYYPLNDREIVDKKKFETVLHNFITFMDSAQKSVNNLYQREEKKRKKIRQEEMKKKMNIKGNSSQSQGDEIKLTGDMLKDQLAKIKNKAKN